MGMGMEIDTLTIAPSRRATPMDTRVRENRRMAWMMRRRVAFDLQDGDGDGTNVKTKSDWKYDTWSWEWRWR